MPLNVRGWNHRLKCIADGGHQLPRLRVRRLITAEHLFGMAPKHQGPTVSGARHVAAKNRKLGSRGSDELNVPTPVLGLRIASEHPATSQFRREPVGELCAIYLRVDLALVRQEGDE